VLREEAVREGCITTADLAARKGQMVRTAGVLAAARRIVTFRDRLMQFVTLEDEHGLVEAVLFPQAYAALSGPVTNPGPFLVEGVAVEDHGDIHVQVSKMTPFFLRAQPYGPSPSPPLDR